MPDLTPNFNIPKPTEEEYVNLDSYNAVLDQIDSAASQASNIKIADADNKISATTVEGAIQELFTNADNAQRSFAGVVGSPSVPGDTVTKITNDLQTVKNTLASNLTAKGQPSQGTEPVKTLADKVANVNTGKKFANGTVTASSVNGSFQLSSGGAMSSRFAEVTGLSFKPSFILLESRQSSVSFPTSTYSEQTSNDYPKVVKATTFGNASHSGAILNTFKGDVSDAYVNSSGFKLPVSQGGIEYKWVAYE